MDGLQAGQHFIQTPFHRDSRAPEDRHTVWGLEQFPNPANPGQGFHSSLTQWLTVFPVPGPTSQEIHTELHHKENKPGIIYLI